MALTTVPLRSVTSGRGAPLLLLHGFGLSPLTYLRTIDRLAVDARVVAPWLRPPRQRWSFEGLLDAVVATLDAQEIASVEIVGHSFGGAVALALAGRHPERVHHVVLVDAMGLSPGRARVARLGLRASHLRSYTRYAPARDFVRWVARHPRDVAAAAWWSWGCDLVEAAATVRGSAMARTVVWGADDSLLPTELGARLAAALDAPFVVVSGRAPDERIEHDWPYRRPQLFAERIGGVRRGSGIALTTPSRRSGAG